MPEVCVFDRGRLGDSSWRPSRRGFLMSSLAIMLGAAGVPVLAQKVSLEATKRKIELADDLYILNETLLTEAAAVKLDYETEDSKAILEVAFSEVNRHLDLLLNGEPGTELEAEHSVAVQLILKDLQAEWAVYGADLHTLTGHAEIPTEELLKVREDSHAFGGKVKELVDTIYDVYGEVMFSAEELRAITLLAHERAHVEEMKEEMIFAAVLPEEKAAHMAKLTELGGVFSQTIDVLIRNGAMFGVAPPPSREATAALELVEEHWAAKAELIAAIEANGNITNKELHEFFLAAKAVAGELDSAIKLYHGAMHASEG